MLLLTFLQHTFPNDSGPIYKETVAGRFPVEPFNTYSNFIFLFIVLYFFLKIYNRPRQHWFLMITLPLIFVGYVGGTLYHGLRSAEIWLLLDWVPIRGLSFLAVLYFIFKWKDTWSQRILFILAIGAAFIGLRYLPVPENIEHNLGYLINALSILIPVIGYLSKTSWKHAAWAFSGFFIFGCAIGFRFIDQRLDFEVFWMGTHWLWHLLGGLAVFCILNYIFLDNKAQAEGIS
ncbi:MULTISPECIES: hypothetical protein [unclassified Leeuwenhoekiella]|uniref:hypothetical protein n=1 Tax=unclassified Leeuwenhoekiella TaxID=2615029 RepID=UPI0025BADDE4|nr:MULTISPECIES: hypothetical protein [unclassified Leeuwenhoekiella]